LKPVPVSQRADSVVIASLVAKYPRLNLIKPLRHRIRPSGASDKWQAFEPLHGQRRLCTLGYTHDLTVFNFLKFSKLIDSLHDTSTHQACFCEASPTGWGPYVIGNALHMGWPCHLLKCFVEA